MRVNLLDKVNIEGLEKLLLKDGLIVPVYAEQLKEFSQNQISQFCHQYAIYQVPTIELINFLQNEIGNLNAIEIGSGNGAIGRSLNIVMTDNKMQEIPEIKLHYTMLGQPTINYPEDVIKLDGNSAVKKFNPEIVIGSWITGTDCGNAFGVNESDIVKSVKKYIHIGNEITHSKKQILRRLKYKTIKAVWLISRSLVPHKNLIYIFENSKG